MFHYAESRILFIIMLNAITLSFVMLNFIMLSFVMMIVIMFRVVMAIVIMLSDIMLSAAAPKKWLNLALTVPLFHICNRNTFLRPFLINECQKSIKN